MEQGGTDEAFVASKKFELAVDEREKLFFEWRFAETLIVTNGGYGVINLFLEEKECNVFFGSEVIEDRAFRDARFARDGFRSRGVEAFGLEKSESRFDYAVTNDLFALGALTRLGRLGDFCLRRLFPRRFCRGPGSHDRNS